MDRVKPKELRKIDDGRIFGYTDALAKRPDMVPIWPDNVDPNTGVVPEEGTRVESKDRQLRSVIVEKDTIILGLQRQVDDLSVEISELNEEISRLNRALNASDSRTVATGTESAKPAGNDMETRDNLILKTAKDMLDSGERINFTGQGKLRIERIEALSGLNDVTSQDREKAMKALGKQT